MKLTDAEKRCLGAILDYASDRMSSAGCNDFDLAEHMPDVDERRELMRKYHEHNGDPEEFDPGRDYEIESDFVVLEYLRHKLGIP